MCDKSRNGWHLLSVRSATAGRKVRGRLTMIALMAEVLTQARAATTSLDNRLKKHGAEPKQSLTHSDTLYYQTPMERNRASLYCEMT
jgi:hypothetical protein